MRANTPSWRGLRSLVLAGALVTVTVLAGCGWLAAPPPANRTVPNADVERGRDLMISHGCVTCHTIPGVAGTNGHVGPPLTNWARRIYIAGEVPNEPDNLIRWIQNPKSISPGTAMPVIAMSEDDARDMAGYLYTID